MAVIIGHMLFKLAGLIQVSVMGRMLTKDVYDAVYGFAFENCVFTLFLVGEEVIGPVLMPMFMRELDSEGGERSAWSLAHAVFRIQAVVLAVVVALLMAMPEGFVAVFTKWTAAKRPEAFGLAATSVRALAPALIGLSLASTTYVVLNAYKRFFLAAFADAIWKFAAVGAVLLAAVASRGQMRQSLVAGLLIGSVLKMATHLWGLRDKRGLFRARPDFHHPALRQLGALMLPLVVGILFAKWRDVFNNTYILSGLEEAGLIQANSMGKKLNGAISMLVPYTLSIAIFPFLCEMVDRRARDELGALLTHSGRMLLAVLLPLSCVVAVVSVPLTGLLFGGGHFDAVAVSRTAVSMACYTFALPAVAIEMLVMQAFFAHRRTVSVTVAGIVFSGLSVGISYYAVVVLGWQGALALAAVAGGLTLTRWLKAVALVALLRKDAPVFPVAATMGFLVRAALASGLSAAAAWGGLRLVAALGVAGGSKLALLSQLAAAAACAALGFVAGCALCRVHEPREMLVWTLTKLRRKARGPKAAVSLG
jgi:putative peptidoglycan lipid II flippase